MKKAFTLSEVLVTLGIIGVVSALTVPTLLQHHQRQVLVTQLKKDYAVITQALETAMASKNTASVYESKVFKDGPEGFIREYLRTTNVCNSGNISDCIDVNDYSKISGSYEQIKGPILTANYACGVLKDGSVVCTRQFAPFAWGLAVDVNGKQGPNIQGRDLFYMNILDNGDIVGYLPYEEGVHTSSDDIDAKCAFDKILKDGWQMNY